MASPVQVGQIIAGKYRVDAIIGQGGMGVVVAATDTVLERRVAIKFLLAQYAQNPLASGRFLREARATARLNSEHAIRIIEVGQLEDGAPFMAMELLNGVDLGTLVERQGALELRVAVDYLLQACRGLGDAHQAGIIHRDVKPSNLFLSYQPSGKPLVKVLDFGVSKLNLGVEAGAGALTTTGQTLGSPLYMAPEQMRSSQHVDARSDIWGLGVVLFELLTGARPFTAESLAELVLVINQDPPRDPRTLRPDLPEGVCRIILRCLEKDPGRRYASVGDLAADLQPYGSAQRGAPGPIPTDPPPTPHVMGRQGTLLVTGADHPDLAALARMADAVLGPENAANAGSAPYGTGSQVVAAPYGAASTYGAAPASQYGGASYGGGSQPGAAAYGGPHVAGPSPVPAAPGATGSASSAPWASTNDDQRTPPRKKGGGPAWVLGASALGAVLVAAGVAFYITSQRPDESESSDILSAASDLSQADHPVAPPDPIEVASAASALPPPTAAAPSSSAPPATTASAASSPASSLPAPSATAPKPEPREGTRRRPRAPKSAKERLGF